MFPNENKSLCEEGINISKRQASILVALFLFLGLSVFIVGYFLGKKSMLDSLTDSFEQEIEKLDQSLERTAANQFDGAPDTSEINQSFAFDNSQQNESNNEIALEELPALPEDAVKTSQESSSADREKSKEAPVAVFAQLIGFGAKHSATAFKKRLENKNVDVVIKTRSSRTSKGKKRTWYQAVTPVFSSFEELDQVVKKIQKLEFIRTKDINIVHIKEQEDKV